ncbi:PfkB family carbohydrate kinase [Ktedonosporobacter rubrisoli]|nr:PfkB family carbohydrate kinase [Ktedonosporobacter rubrisoli]
MQNIPDFLAIGHVTRDLHADGSFSVGGAVTFATCCASRLGLSAGMVTSADPEIALQLPNLLPDVALAVRPSQSTTTYANRYSNGVRERFCLVQSEPLSIVDIPQQWFSAPIVLFGVQAQEIGADIILRYPRQPATLLAAIPQGWLGSPDATGYVQPRLWQEIERVLPALDVLIVSREDLLPFSRDAQEGSAGLLSRWSQLVPCLIATDGSHGATLFQHGSKQHFPAYLTHEIDPTGAGDVFTAAFLTHIHRYRNPEQAIDFANCAASFAVEQPGLQGIPTLAMVKQRWNSYNQ